MMAHDSAAAALPVAHHVIHALDQNSLVPASDRVFGPFRLAIPLPQSVADQIHAAALAVTPGVLDVIHEVAAAGLRAGAGPAQLGDGAPDGGLIACQNLPSI